MPDAGSGQSQPAGQIVTFYSFKGGTGRTMALANVAWILAANGKRVLMADWDLESPGLHRFFQPFVEAGVSDRPGIVDFIRRYTWAVASGEIDPDALYATDEHLRKAASEAVTSLIDEHIFHVNDYAIPLNWQFPDKGALHLLSSGKQANGDYQATLSALDWDNFYDNLYGGQFLDALRTDMKRHYDYVLIDSRTGLSDVADICTVHLPDMVVDCFTLATQGIEGAAMIARSIQGHTERDITILPVPMRIDHSQKERVDAGLNFAAHLFGDLFAGMPEEQRRAYWTEVEVPYRPSYAYEETLAAFADRPGSPTGLLRSYERITSRITAGAVNTLPPREEWLRLRTRLLFSRSRPSSSIKVVLDFAPEDQLWAEWIAAVLASAEIPVRMAGEVPADRDEDDLETQTVAIVSASYLELIPSWSHAEPPDLLISVTETRLPAALADVPVLFLAGLSETQAVERLIDRLDGRRPADPESGIDALRYPGIDRPKLTNIPVRNVNFTGRDDYLRLLREGLRSRRLVVVLPLTIQGLGGVGKTQVALEYAHRFKADYDIVWWMNCGQSQEVGASLADLGQQMREAFGLNVPEEGGVAEIARHVLQALSDERSGLRWLLVYDNAEDIETVRALLPSGEGHVLITSRQAGWEDLDRSLQVDVFKRSESISHLRRRRPGITEEEAGDVARILGDMPLAVAAAGALLASTNISVSEYLQRLEQGPVLDLAPGHPLHDYPVAITNSWNLSLDQLRVRSAAAARLLEICSVMAPDIGLELIFSQAMAHALREIDPAVSEPALIARLVRQADLLALIKLDNSAGEIQVHRVVQALINERMSSQAREAAWRTVHQILAAARPDGDVDDPRMWPRYRLIWPHLTPSRAMWSTEETVRQLLIERVRYLWIRDDLDRALRRAQEIESAWESMLGSGPEPEVASALRRQLFRLRFNLANIMRDLARFQGARAVDEAVLREQQDHLGSEHPHTLQTRSSLAADLRALGDYAAALDVDEETYTAWETGFGDEYQGTLSAAHNLALSHLLTGDFQRALAQDRLTLERRTSVHGPMHPRTLNSAAAVARDLLEAGRYAEAVTRLGAVWAQYRETLGEDDRAVLNTRRMLGVALRYAGRLEEADVHIDAARIGLTRGFGKNSNDALACRLSQALTWLGLGQVQEARTAVEEVLSAYERQLGSGHPHSLACKLDIATALCFEEDYRAAEASARSATQGLENRLGPSHPYTLAAQLVLASTLAFQGQLAEAEQLEYGVVDGRQQVLGPQHPDTLRSRANLLLTRHELGIDERASSERQAVIEDLAALIGSEHPDITSVIRGDRLLGVIDPQPF